MHLFTLRLGDWGGDGHGHYHDSVVTSAMPFKRVQMAYGRIAEKTGIEVEQICSDFGESEISEDVAAKLQEIGLDKFNEDRYINKCELADIIVFLLNTVDPELQLKIVDVPVLDSSAGYGLFCE